MATAEVLNDLKKNAATLYCHINRDHNSHHRTKQLWVHGCCNPIAEYNTTSLIACKKSQGVSRPRLQEQILLHHDVCGFAIVPIAVHGSLVGVLQAKGKDRWYILSSRPCFRLSPVSQPNQASHPCFSPITHARENGLVDFTGNVAAKRRVKEIGELPLKCTSSRQEDEQRHRELKILEEVCIRSCSRS
jgi:hypothetical protein